MMNSQSELKQAMVARGLQSCRLFAGLRPEDLREIASITGTRRVERGGYVFREGQRATAFFVVQQGAVSVHRVNPAGREQVLHIFRAGESFAEATLASESGYPADARAVEPTQLLVISRQDFLELLRRHPELAVRLLVGMSMRLRTLVAQLEDMTLNQVEDRLIHWLLKRCPQTGGTQPVTIRLTTTKRVLAAELGTVSETLSRTLARFRQEGLLEVKGSVFTVRNPAKLKAHLDKG